MKYSHVLWSCWLTLAACGPAPRTRNAFRGPPRFVLVTQGTVLRMRPDENAPGITLPVASPFRKVRTQGDWTEIETVQTPVAHCVSAWVPPTGMALRFHVHGPSFDRVLARPLQLSAPRSSLTLQPGIPVPRESSRTVVHEGLRVHLLLDPSFAYDYLEPHADRIIQRAERLAPGTQAQLPDGASFEVTRDTRVYVFNRHASGDGSHVSISTRCARIETSVPDGAVLPNLDLVFGDETTERMASRWTVRSGARLRWSDGSSAGRSVSDVALPGEGHTLLGDRCFDLSLTLFGVTEAPPLSVSTCVAERDLRPTN
jgi:hypothetical protein